MEDYKETAKYIDEILKTFFKNHWANFNQTWRKAFLGKED